MTAGALDSRLQDVLPPEAVGEHAASDGIPACPLVAPGTPDEWRALLQLAARERLSLVPLGAGSKTSWCRPPAALDLVVSTRRWKGVVAYEPADGTLTARAGTPWSELAAAVQAGGHALTPDVPEPEHATLGGVVAAGQSGWDRLRFGPVRHHVLGAHVIDAQGRVTKSGGRLVKNVTGYDLHRLHTGAHGTLGIVLEASLRLFPEAREHAVTRAPCRDRGHALELAGRLLDPPLRPLAVCAHDLEGTWQVVVALAGSTERVRWEHDRVRETLAAAGELDDRVGSDARAALASLRDLERWRGRWPTLSLTTKRTALARTLEALEDAIARAGWRAHVLAHPGVASAGAWIEEGAEDAPGDVESWLRLEARLHEAGLRPLWRGAPAAARARLAVLGPPSPGLALMRQLKERLDPQGVFASGRFHGGI